MKNIFLISAVLCVMASGLRADEGCGQAADACKPQIKKLTPFMAELKKAQVAVLKQSSVREPALEQGGPKAKLAVPAIPADIPKPTPAGNEKTVSNPVWLLAGAGLLAALYYFLKESKKKRKR